MIDAAATVGTHDVVLLTLDSLRLDVARAALAAGDTPTLAGLLPASGWQERHTPGTFTLPAHQAFLTGFLPTPTEPTGPHRRPRLFAGEFDGARGIGPGTFRSAEPCLPEAFAARGYRTVCSGGVGFFSGQGALGSLIPGLFAEAHWSRATSVHARDSAAHQFTGLADRLGQIDERVFALVNVAATHTPTHLYLPGERRDSVHSQQAALADVDTHLPVLLDALAARGPTLLIVCADHGTCFGDDGWWGHGLAHPAVTTVPYLEIVLPRPDRPSARARRAPGGSADPAGSPATYGPDATGPATPGPAIPGPAISGPASATADAWSAVPERPWRTADSSSAEPEPTRSTAEDRSAESAGGP